MHLPDPMDATCSYCGGASSHELDRWLALGVTCPHCSASLDEFASRTKAMVDDWMTFCTWCEVSIAVENLLGIAPPGVSDDSILIAKPSVALTLRDLVGLVAEQFPEKLYVAGDAAAYVRQAAEHVGRRSVSEAELDLPLLDVLGHAITQRHNPSR